MRQRVNLYKDTDAIARAQAAAAAAGAPGAALPQGAGVVARPAGLDDDMGDSEEDEDDLPQVGISCVMWLVCVMWLEIV